MVDASRYHEGPWNWVQSLLHGRHDGAQRVYPAPHCHGAQVHLVADSGHRGALCDTRECGVFGNG